jgi:hypothetical protein
MEARNIGTYFGSESVKRRNKPPNTPSNSYRTPPSRGSPGTIYTTSLCSPV